MNQREKTCHSMKIRSLVISVEGYSPALHERHGPTNMGALGERDISVLDQCSDLTLLEHSL